MPVDICQPPAGKRSLTCSSGASSFDIFRPKDARLCNPPFATRVSNDAKVKQSNPYIEAVRGIHEEVPDSTSGRPKQPAFARGESHITFGECMTPQETEDSLVRRPGSECRQRDLIGNHIFEGPYPVKENCGGYGLDIIGSCPFRPCSSSKIQELAGHNVFAVSDACDTPPPPPRVPYCPKERCIPPHNMPRNPKKFESHMQMGGPVGAVEPWRPSTCLSSCPSSYEINYNGNGNGNDVLSRARQVEEAKTRAFQGNHIFDFNDEPRNLEEDEDHFSFCKQARRRDLRGNDIFGELDPDNPWDLPSTAPCGKRHGGPCSQQSLAVDPQALLPTDPARFSTVSEPDSCLNC